jgi:sec-independent protein translocase protein TatA
MVIPYITSQRDSYLKRGVFMMPGWSEWLLILLIILLLFGAKRLPEIAKSLGKGIREFKKAIKGEDDEPSDPHDPKKS